MEFILGFLPGGMELIVVLFAILLFFGGRKIPELMRGIGKGVKEFNQASDNMKKSIDEGMKEADQMREERHKKEREKAEQEKKETE